MCDTRRRRIQISTVCTTVGRSVKVTTHVTVCLSIMLTQYFCKSVHNFLLSPHGTQVCLSKLRLCFKYVEFGRGRRACFSCFCYNFKKKKNRKNKRAMWCKEWLMKRKTYSHINLLNELKIHPRDWHNYLRMDEETYLNLLNSSSSSRFPFRTSIVKTWKQDTNKFFIHQQFVVYCLCLCVVLTCIHTFSFACTNTTCTSTQMKI